MAARVVAVDCETDPFLYGRFPKPFIWGAFDGATFATWRDTNEFANWLERQECVAYAHNGGKFDWTFLLHRVKTSRDVKIIGGRIAELKLGRATLRDSYSIIPVPLKEIQKDDIDYSLMEADRRDAHMREIIDYLETDVRVLHLVVEKFREEAGRGLTIAGNAYAFAKKSGMNAGRSSFEFDEAMRRYYFGGRTECFRKGVFENLFVYDIRSSYPYAMSRPHACGTQRDEATTIAGLADEAIERAFLTVRCYSDGAFPRRKDDGGIEFPQAFDEYNVTGWEFLAAKRFGLIRNERIIRVLTFPQTVDFSDYVAHWYAHKEANRPRATVEQKAQYTIGKIMMNALYGKLAQNPMNYYDWRLHPSGTAVDDGWEHYGERIADGVELHRRPAMAKIMEEHGKSWPKAPIFNNVATGASITGFARAHLLSAMMRTGRERVIYCDTDSLITDGEATGLDISPRLGAWNEECRASVGCFAGKKLYAMRLAGKDAGKVKVASKGSRLEFDEMMRIVSGEAVLWKNPAPTFSLALGPRFVQREIRATM